MENNKLIAIVAAVVLVIAAVGVVLYMNSEEPEKKGLYKLNPVVSDVDMGKCSATPAVIITFETMYEDYYGDLVKSDLTLADAKADTAFWNEYCNWSSLIDKQSNGTLNVTISTGAKGTEVVNVPVCDGVVVMGTMYSETLYYLACAENNVTPYTEESYNNAAMKEYMNSTIAGGMQYSYYSQNDSEYMLRLVDQSTYYDLGTNSVQSVDSEKLASALMSSKNAGHQNTIYLGSGTRISTSEHYNTNTGPCNATGSYYAFFGPSNIKDVFSCVDCIGQIMGFSDETINKVIEDIQLRLYKVYYSVQEKTEGKEPVKAYWESGSGKAVNSAMAKVILNFLGFDASMLDGAEHSLESLLVESPKYLIFYTNDGRSEDDRMRVNN